LTGLAGLQRAGVQQVAHGSSRIAAFHRAPTAIDRKADAQATPLNESPAIDRPNTPPEPTMNTPLPRTPASTRFAAVFAAAIVTLATLSGIDNLAATESSAALVATQAAAQRV
jgi:hypothetical protein